MSIHWTQIPNIYIHNRVEQIYDTSEADSRVPIFIPLLYSLKY